MRFAAPSEAVPIVALLAGGVLLALPSARRSFTRGSQGAFMLMCASLAALLSAGYVAFYLRGGPRIIDATSYLLEARALSEGHLAWRVPEPATSVTGRFLVRDGLAHSDHVAGIFPPGYPLLLAIGCLVRAPMFVGPALAFGLTYATAFLAKSALPEDAPAEDRDLGVRLAVALSAVCAALRYHTADTMSHGLAACLVAVALGCALELHRGKPGPHALGLGASLGWLVCTRPVSGVAVAATLIAGSLVARATLSRRDALKLAAAAAPFLVLFAAHQKAATGAWWTSSQARYYAVSDGPPGCFSYGLGDRIGCRHEHGDFVARYMPDGFGVSEAVMTTGRRLAMHGVDAMNAAPLSILILVAIGFAALRSARGPRVLAAVVGAFVIGYAPFYFDGNYPGGGARFYADVLPAEHVLVAWLVTITPRARRMGLDRAAAIISGAALVGFAFFAHVDHEQLRAREGGRPMFEPARLRAAGVSGGLVFVDTDHGFALGYDPNARASADAVEVARYRGDALDWLFWNERARPPSYRYRFDAETGAVTLDPYEPRPGNRIEAEHLWPALEQRGASATPRTTTERCASGGRWLVVTSDKDAGQVRLALPRALIGRRVIPIVMVPSGARATLGILSDHERVASVTVDGSGRFATCTEGPPLDVPQRNGRLELVMEGLVRGADAGLSADGVFALDALIVEGLENSR